MIHALGVEYIYNKVTLTIGCHYRPREFIKHVDWKKLFWDSLMNNFGKHAIQACFKISCTAITSDTRESSFCQL